MKAEITHEGEQVVITLKTGERFFICEHHILSVEGFSLKVICEGGLLIKPDASNAAIITTPRALRAQEAAIDQVVAERERKYGQ